MPSTSESSGSRHPTNMMTGEHKTPVLAQPDEAAGSPATLAPTELGDYEILVELGRGGMGVVFKARQKNLGRIVALKMILSNQVSATVLERFRQEAHAAASLDHPGIVPLFDFGEIAGQPYFTMAYIEGTSLAGMLKKEGPLPPRQAASILRQLSSAVAYAHERGILHRDLKPDNILIDQQGHPRITDFGLARRRDSDVNLTNTGSVVGTPAYMAPEQAEGRRDLTPAVDIYSLGAVLHTLLVGEAPFTGSSVFEVLLKVGRDRPRAVRQINPALPEALERICSRCLEKDPSARYQTASALAQDLQAWLDNDTEAKPTAWLPPPGRSSSLSGLQPASIQVPPAPANGRSLFVPVAVLMALLCVAGVVGYHYLPVGTPSGQAAAAAPDWGELITPTTVDFPVSVSILDAPIAADGVHLLQANRPIRLAVEPSEDAYVGIWSLQADGSVVQLFPNKYDNDSLVRARTTRVIPGNPRYQILVQPAAGLEYLRVVASSKPWQPAKGENAGPFILFPQKVQGEWMGHQRGLITTRGLAVVEVDKEKRSVKAPETRITEAVLRYRVSSAK